MDLSQVASAAKMLFPKWRDKIEQAQQLAGQFHPSKDGVAQLMQKYGKNREDLRQAAAMLQNPIIKNTLGRVPGLSEVLTQGADALLNEAGGGQPAAASPTMPAGSPSMPTSGGAAELMARLRKLG